MTTPQEMGAEELFVLCDEWIDDDIAIDKRVMPEILARLKDAEKYQRMKKKAEENIASDERESFERHDPTSNQWMDGFVESAKRILAAGKEAE